MYADLTGLLDTFSGKSKAAAIAGLAINTALRLSETAQNTAAAQMRAYAELGPVAGAAAAAKIALYGKVQMGLIAAASALRASGAVGGAKGGSYGGGSSNSIASSPQQAAPAAPQDLIIDLSSTDPAMRVLAQALLDPMIKQLQKASKNGVNIVGVKY